jgi:predicted exporter
MRWRFAIGTMLMVGVLFYLGQSRLKLETDILDSLSLDDPVILDAQYVMDHHSILDRVVVDLSLDGPQVDPDRLVAASKKAKEVLLQSGQFQSVGTEEMGQGFPALLEMITNHLPFFFNLNDLESHVLPRLKAEFLDGHFSQLIAELSEITGIGQSASISRDPLNLRDLVLQRLGRLYPSAGAQIYKGQILSADGQHLLLPAEPKAKSTDSQFAQHLDAAFNQMTSQIQSETTSDPRKVRVVPVGAYRAALDNESIARKDANMIIIWVSVITLLLLSISFPRPWFGALSMIPGFVGPIIGLLVYSFLKPSMSILTLGFGGVIISFTVDQGIAYLLFLDRNREVSGNMASQEVWTATLITSLVNALAFLALQWSGFSILGELGLFAALGIIFTFLFVHVVFSKWFHTMKAASHRSILPIDRMTSWMALSGGSIAAWVAVGFACLMVFFAKPEFKVDLRNLNTLRHCRPRRRFKRYGVMCSIGYTSYWRAIPWMSFKKGQIGWPS